MSSPTTNDKSDRDKSDRALASAPKPGFLSKISLPVDGFLIGMVVAIGLAWIHPDGAKQGGWMHATVLGRIGIALVFFINGAMLPFAALRAGASAWRTHLLVQGFTFVLFPLVGVVALASIGGQVPPPLRTGLFFLCALPSTITSAVALTSAANGNVPLAIFNSSLSSILGVFLTPLWVSSVLVSASHAGSPSQIVANSVLLLLLPLGAGQWARRWIGAWLSRHKRSARLVDRSVILLLIHASFCNSFASGVWTDYGWVLLASALVGSALLFGLMFHASSYCGRWLALDESSRRAAVLCASQKSLAVGVPMAQLFFGTTPEAGVILLPILTYHPMQLALSGWIVGRWANSDA